ncbi:MAG TPA: sugar-binding protein [Polyangia bacterium]
MHRVAPALVVSLALAAGPAAAATVDVPYGAASPVIGTGTRWWAQSRLFDFDTTYAYGDNAVTVYGQWRADALYLAAEVADTLLYATHTPRDSALTWENDGIELFFDLALTGGNTIGPGDQTFRQYIFTIASGLFDAYGGCDTADTTFNGNATFYATVDGTLNGSGAGFVIEAKIPWADLGLNPHAGLTFGFDVANDDKDDFNQGSAIIEADWAQLGTTFAQPGQWNQLRLAGGPDGGVADGGAAADAAAHGDGGGGGTPVNPGGNLPQPSAGCSCRAGGAPVSGGLLALALGLGSLARRRRRG